MTNNEEIELNFDVNMFECYKAFKYKYTKSSLSKIKLFSAMIVPVIIGVIILIIKSIYNYFAKKHVVDVNFQRSFIAIMIFCGVWMIATYVLYKKRVHTLASLENENHMEGKISYKNKIVLGENYMSVNSEVFYGRVYYKGIQDIIIFKDIIVILVKPLKIVIIPISAFDNLESRKNFISILSEKIEKKRII